MNRATQLFLSILAILAIALNVHAFIEGNRTYHLISVLVVMPTVAVLTFVVLMRGQKKEQERRFPGAGERRSVDEGSNTSSRGVEENGDD
jgi:hypothetical protein